MASTTSNDDGDSGKEPPEERDNNNDATNSPSKKTKKKQTSQKRGSTNGGTNSRTGSASSTTKNGKRKKAANDEEENATASSETNSKKKRAKMEEKSSLKKSTAATKTKKRSAAAAGASESTKKKGKKETAKEETAVATKNKKRTATATKAKKGADTTTSSSTSSTKKTTTTKRKRRRRSSDTAATAAAAEQQAQELLSLAAPPQPKPRVDPFPLAKNLLAEVEFTLLSVQQDLDTTKQLLEQYHPPTIQARKQQGGSTGNTNATKALLFLDDAPINTANSKKAADTDTAGHSNTNHQVVVTGNARQDKLREYQRHYQQRQRILLPEGKGSDRWDKQKVPGQRRRRIHREADLPQAPPAPPPVGYSVFVGQMTTKIRHDRPDQHHNQPKVMQEIAKLWRDDMSEDDRNYYIQFANAAKMEYVRQQMEFRATSTYTPSQTFLRLGGPHGPWVPHNAAQRNALEREIAGYETYDFPLRPACMDEDYQWRDWRSKVNRKLKLRRLIVDYHDPQEQRIVAQAIDHAKATLMDAAGIALADVDHSAILAAATHECIVKLEELHKAVNRANDNRTTTTAEQTQTTREEEGEEEADNDGEVMVEV